MFKKKLLFKSSLLMGAFGSVATLVACSTPEAGTGQVAPGNPEVVDSKKEIIIAVDGKQKTFYNKLIELFKNTDSYKAGYRIKTIDKDVFGALDPQVGITDPSVPDIFYAPHDRVTTFVNSNQVVDLEKFDPTLLDEVAKIIHATEAEKKDMIDFGSVSGFVGTGQNIKVLKKLFGIRHNLEGIILASNKNKEEALKELNDPNTDSLEELVKAGKAIIRLQDFWYGNGILGGYFNEIEQSNPEFKRVNEDLMSRILYSVDGGTVSGFQNVEKNKYYEYFKEGVKIATRLYFPVYEAAYLLDPNKFSETPWAKKGISQDDLKAVLTSDMNQVQNKIFELMKKGQIDYAIIGTWDLQNSENSGGAKSFFNIGQTVDGHHYRQALGAWSFLVNQRNAGVPEERKKAISQIIKLAVSPDPNFEYFKSDSKVQFTVGAREAIRNKIIQNLEDTNVHYKEFIKRLGYASHKELLKELQPILSLEKSRDNTPFYEWEVNKNVQEPLNDVNLLKFDVLGQKDIIKNLPLVQKEDTDNFVKTLKDETGLRNALASMFSKTLKEFQFQEKSWLINDGIVKPEAFDNEKYKELKDDKAWHLRKVEKQIFGANGDNNDDKVKLVNKVLDSLKNNSLDNLYKEVEDKALQFIKEVAVTPADDQIIKKAVKLYLNNYVNQALWYDFVTKKVKEQEKIFLTPKGTTLEEASSEVANFEKTLSFDKLLQVVESKTPIKEGGQGQIVFQSNRIDHSNPQFEKNVWDNWNGQTFGNVLFLQNIAQESGTKDLNWFENKILEKLNERFTAASDTINKATTSSTSINFDQTTGKK
ncbi:Maltose-binding periplasmic proteins/domains [Mycoplasmopsis citelli]|uniref:Maltose-binding periplasmic proteins/domains n=1 Tax=Mycoplasmopsis citelli TaxID=171281 RepID=A0A449B2E4_9BACT|nr:hypothetical protein [Mycoplasmopsis citelli]VEU74777.1 Maltose-binding periplasmic proteins/domains [Mycoplasmopsis citelli]